MDSCGLGTPLDSPDRLPLSDAETLRACLRMLDALEDLEDGRSVTSNLEADEGCWRR